MNLSGWEIIIILLVLILVFGAAKLPTIASSVGKSMKVFKKEVTELRDDTDVTGKNQAANTTPQNDPIVPQSSYDATAPRDKGQDQNQQ